MEAINSTNSPVLGVNSNLLSGFGLNPEFLGLSDARTLSSKLLILSDKKWLSQIRSELVATGFSSVSLTNQIAIANSSVVDGAIDLLMIDADLLESEEGCEIVESCVNKRISTLVLLTSTDRQHNAELKRMALEIGVDDFLTEPFDGLEVVARTRNTLQSKLASRQLAEFSAQLQSDILIDPLTSVSNRRAFNFELSRKMIEWERQRLPLALLMIDIDYFKRFNDQYGHQAGDQVLIQVAAAIKSAVRDMDLVCRYGGEEFVAILPVKRPQESTQTAERIRQKIARTKFAVNDLQLSVTVSIGVAEAMKGDDQELIVKRADTALYESKRNGRNRVSFHDGARCFGIQQNGGQASKSRREGKGWGVSDDVFNLCSSNILIVDDSRSTALVAKKYLADAGFQNLECENDSRKIMPIFHRNPPDLLILDVKMPAPDGMTILQGIRSDSRFDDIPVIMFTAHTDQETKIRALELGANDFLHKPVVASELVARVTNILLASAHTRFLANYSKRLEQEVQIRTLELIASRREAIQCLARAAEIQNDPTGRHVIRVGKYAAIIADELGFSDTQVVELEHAAQLHDVGNLGLPDELLMKEEQFTDEEFRIIKGHCNHGVKIIRDLVDEETSHGMPDLSLLDSCSTPVMRMAALVAESHHERWDGTGYPHGLSGQNIPVEGRIVAVCDVFDAISNSNSYRQAYDLARSFEIIREGSGSQFDPDIVEAFFSRRHEVIKVYQDFADYLPATN